MNRGIRGTSAAFGWLCLALALAACSSAGSRVTTPEKDGVSDGDLGQQADGAGDLDAVGLDLLDLREVLDLAGCGDMDQCAGHDTELDSGLDLDLDLGPDIDVGTDLDALQDAEVPLDLDVAPDGEGDLDGDGQGETDGDTSSPEIIPCAPPCLDGVCDLAQGVCVECLVDSDCGPVEGHCVQPGCIAGFCQPVDVIDGTKCVSPDCPLGAAFCEAGGCTISEGEPLCTPLLVECTDSGDCLNGRECINGFCLFNSVAECETDVECGLDYRCNAGVCELVTCVDLAKHPEINYGSCSTILGYAYVNGACAPVAGCDCGRHCRPLFPTLELCNESCFAYTECAKGGGYCWSTKLGGCLFGHFDYSLSGCHVEPFSENNSYCCVLESGEICDGLDTDGDGTVDEDCAPLIQVCQDDWGCPTGTVCSMLEPGGGLCIPYGTSSVCIDDSHCLPNERCLHLICRPMPEIPCSTDADCDDGNGCTLGPCDTASDLCALVNICSPFCLVDADCPAYQACNSSTHLCELAVVGTCVTAADCPAGYSCVAGGCQPDAAGACLADAECGQDMRCDNGYCGLSYCTDLAQHPEVDFGACETTLGYAHVNGVCTAVTGCGCGLHCRPLFATLQLCQTSCFNYSDCAQAAGICLVDGIVPTDCPPGTSVASLEGCSGFYKCCVADSGESCDGKDNNSNGAIDEHCIPNTLCTNDWYCPSGTYCFNISIIAMCKPADTTLCLTDSACSADQTCSALLCRPMPEIPCSTDADCDDGNGCTTELCISAGGTCAFVNTCSEP